MSRENAFTVINKSKNAIFIFIDDRQIQAF